MVLTAMLTGLRRGELVNLKWQDIDPLNREITVNQTKNNRIKNIPMNQTLFEELMKLPRNSEYVFANPEGSGFRNLRHQFEAALKRANLTGVCWYTLRHTFASDLAMKGVDLRSIADLLGDKTIQMVMRYSHLSRSHLQDAVAKLDTNLTEKGTNLAHSDIDFTEKSANLLK
jgi:integrase